ncbi:Signal transduction histidine kinase [Arenibacter nanhaiticus]|uniref:histidine kinase n=1 Tax=Arenibacter nanhaiticus TaxID=558155 RepID=A0A1M6IG02_9FLAO|nr:ATP-binding protein [Arenibacter nanhaiticus]SHJ33343.1 Signal transduction histidine kinase [Arenibacter nanhaiticus]
MLKTKLLIIFFLTYITSWGQEAKNLIPLKVTIDNKDILTKDMLQDSLGYIWLVHSRRMVKYDGASYMDIPFDAIFPSKNHHHTDFIEKAELDENGKLWVLSLNGRIAHQNDKGTFTPYNLFTQKQTSPSKKINNITANSNYLLFGTEDGKIYYKKPSSTQIDSVNLDQNNTSIIRGIHDIVEKDGIIWFSTKSGRIYNYNINTKKSSGVLAYGYKINKAYGKIWFANSQGNLCSFTPSESTDTYHTELQLRSIIKDIYFDSKGNVWIATDGNGVYQMNTSTKEVAHFYRNENSEFSLASNTVVKIKEDNHGNIWLFPNNEHLQILPNSLSGLHYHSGHEDNAPTRILTMYKATNDILYIGTDGRGLTLHDTKNNTTTTYDEKEGFEGKYIQSLIELDSGTLLVGTYQQGLWKVNPKTKRLSKYDLEKELGYPPSFIGLLHKDSKNRIWLSTESGVFIFDYNMNLKARFFYGDNGLKGTTAMNIAEDNNGGIWISISNGGLFNFVENKHELSSSQFKNITPENSSLNTNLYHYINDMTVDDNNNLWFIANSTLAVYDIDTQLFKKLEFPNDFKEIRFRSVLSSDTNTLWLSTNEGIFKYNPNTQNVEEFGIADGLQGYNFRSGSSYKDSDGLLYFGGSKGLNYFDAQQMQQKKEYPKLLINGIEVLNRPAASIIPDQINKKIEDIGHLTLGPSQSSFSFRFSALGNTLKSYYQYAYKLHGFDKEWISSKSNNMATYTNIPPGRYTFEVKAGTKKGLWDISPKKVAIVIEAPLWKQTWAYILYFIVLCGMLYAITTWLNLKNKFLVASLKNKQNKEFYDMKMNFFSKMSHEIQTPITLISAPIKDMIKNAKEKDSNQQRLQMVWNNTQRLSRIAAELTTMKNYELGKLQLKVTEGNLIDFIKDIAYGFKEHAKYKGISLKETYAELPEALWFDTQRLEHIVYNLLSNAIKFTPKDGCIDLDVSICEKRKYILIKVSDSGPGIPEKDIDKIFNLFYQSKNGKEIGGTGIGLALVKELATLHHGDITVHNNSSTGATFTLKIPLSGDDYRKEEKQDVTIPEEAPIRTRPTLIEKNSSKKEKTIAIIDDNLDIQIYLRSIFDDSFNLISADNGLLGKQLIEEHLPDLVISDIMMPEMTGIELCQELQKTEKTSHIPVVLLTAKSSTEVKISGMNAGAISYLPKPFNRDELLLKVENILMQQDRLMIKFKSDQLGLPNTTEVDSKSDEFIRKMVDEIENNIDDINFKLENISDALGMSYSALYRKCTQITGKKPVEFLRMYRLKKGAILISKYDYLVSEAAYSVGFGDTKYFSKCFKKEYGMTPAEFKKVAQKDDLETFLKKHDLS